MPETTVQGHHISYRVSGQGRTILCIHGLAGASGFWSDTLKALPLGTQGVAPDLLGFGDSAKPKMAYSIAGHAELLRDFSEVLGVEKLDVIGHSMGGVIALFFVLRWPERVGRLILINTPISGARALHGRGRIGATSLGTTFVKIGLQIPWVLWALRKVPRYYFVLDPRFTDDAKKAPLYSLKRHAEIVRRTDVTPLLKEVSVPTLVMGTDRDGIVRPSEFSLAAQKIPGAELVWIRDAGHCPTLEKPVESHQAINKFLQND